MKFARLHALAFGPFTDKVLDFGDGKRNLVIVYGPNEAGKSALLRAIADLRFGIPGQSTDNFVHPHPQMRIGGEFIDSDGQRHMLVRRKGKSPTLYFTDFSLGGNAGEPVSAAIETQLTCGLRREEYATMFGLDHAALRRGGQDLVNGEGDVGAALFQASAGINNISEILDRLEQTARKYHMPGARGKNAKINEALAQFDKHHAEYKRAIVKPSEWTKLAREHAAAQDRVTALETESRNLNARNALLTEIRAVAPVLRRMDQACESAEALKDAKLLSTTAEAERIAAQAEHRAARANLEQAQRDLKTAQLALTQLNRDQAVIDVAAAIERLVPAAEKLDEYRETISEASGAHEQANREYQRIAADIDTTLAPDELRKKVPSPSMRAEIEELISATENADIALTQHLLTVESQQGGPSDEPLDELPTEEIRIKFEGARAALAREAATIKRLTELPAEIRVAERHLQACLKDIHLAEVSLLSAAKPLLDAEIDEVSSKVETLNASIRSLESQVKENDEELNLERAELDSLLQQGRICTAADVMEARQRRDAGWTFIRGVFIENGAPDESMFPHDKPLPDAYEDAVRHADTVADEVAKHAEQSQKLLASQRTIDKLESKKEAVIAELEGKKLELVNLDKAWRDELEKLNLPALPPAALREWQAKHYLAVVAAETLQAKNDELEECRLIEADLAKNVRLAIIETGLNKPSGGASLGTLSGLADAIAQEILRREKAIAEASGKRKEKEKQLRNFEEREKKLQQECEAAKYAMAARMAELLLPATAPVGVAKARLAEFEQFLAAEATLQHAAESERKANESLRILNENAQALATALNLSIGPDLRIFIDGLSTRLAKAKQAERDFSLAEQAVQTAQVTLQTHEDDAKRHEATLQELCRAAGVASADDLPDAEHRSKRKRELQDEIGDLQGDLAEASPGRTIDELRALVQKVDLASIADEIEEIERKLESITKSLAEAREHEQASRTALEAIDDTDAAAVLKEEMERSIASVQSSLAPWMRSRLAHALLSTALKSYRERAQGPMLRSAAKYFEKMTGGEFVRLDSDDTGARPILIAERKNGGQTIRVETMSEGTRDQLYLSLRLAALEMQREAGVHLPAVFDDVLMTSDDQRALLMLEALNEFSKGHQTMVFTHHSHLVDLAKRHLPAESLAVVEL